MEANIGLYELNRSIIDQQGPLNKENIPEKMTLLKEFVEDTRNNFYMLYGKEISYFTLFIRDKIIQDFEGIDSAISECLIHVGPIHSIELTTNKDAVEIWVKDTEKNLLTCMYLFPYDDGIVRIK